MNLSQKSNSCKSMSIHLNIEKNLCVDLDKTFLIHDSSILILISLLKTDPLETLAICLKSKNMNQAKKILVDKIQLSILEWTINQCLYDFIISKKHSGYKIHLVSGSNIKVCSFIAYRFQIFDSIHCSNMNLHLKGRNKAIYLENLFGYKNFTYIGDAFKDIYVWKVAEHGFFPKSKRFKMFFVKYILKISSI